MADGGEGGGEAGHVEEVASAGEGAAFEEVDVEEEARAEARGEGEFDGRGLGLEGERCYAGLVTGWEVN